MKKDDALREEMIARIYEHGFQVKLGSQWNPMAEITDPETGKYFAEVTVSQRNVCTQPTIRVKHAGMPHLQQYGFEAKAHALDPYREWHWAGRSYRKVDSAMQAINLFRSSIPSDKAVEAAVAEADFAHRWQQYTADLNTFKTSFTAEQLSYLLALGVDTEDERWDDFALHYKYAEKMDRSEQKMNAARVKMRRLESEV